MYADEVSKALISRYSIIHVMGDQCGETAQEIIRRKIHDNENRYAKLTLWAQHSRLAKPDHVRSLCAKGTVYLYLVADRRGGRIRMPGQQTKAKYRAATHYHPGDRGADGWKLVSELNISDVTDNRSYLDNQKAYALALGPLQYLDPAYPIRMQDWANTTGEAMVPVRTRMGAHAICAEREDMSKHAEVWIKERVIIAIAPLVEPFAVWLK
jgi:hypothetical protein